MFSTTQIRMATTAARKMAMVVLLVWNSLFRPKSGITDWAKSAFLPRFRVRVLRTSYMGPVPFW